MTTTDTDLLPDIPTWAMLASLTTALGDFDEEATGFWLAAIEDRDPDLRARLADTDTVGEVEALVRPIIRDGIRAADVAR